MRFNELRENEPLEVIEVTEHFEPPTFDWQEASKSNIIEAKKIQTKIFTDGEIAKESDEISSNISEYYIGKKQYQYAVDTLKTKTIYFKNHSYVITYLLAQELVTMGNVTGWFDVVKEISIYLKNPEDKKALKNAKQAIKEIKIHNRSVDYSSLITMLCSQNNKLRNFETEEISKNVYSLRKTK